MFTMGGKNGLVIFDTSKIKLVTFYYHQVDHEFSPVIMKGCIFNKASCFVCYNSISPTRPQIEFIYMMLEKW